MRRGPYRGTKRKLRDAASHVTDDDAQLYLRGIATRVRNARIERDLTIEQLAARSGISYPCICRLESARSQRGPWTRGPLAETIVRLARAMGLHPSELMP